MKGKQNEGFVSDPLLLPRIKEHCLNFADQKFFRPEDVAFDLQRKYHEYGRKKYKPFVAMVREGLNRLNIKDRPENAEAVSTENNDDVTVVLEKKSENAVVRPTEPSKNERKRKALSSNSSAPKVEDVCISSDEDNDRKFEEYKGTNGANKAVLNLYSKKDAPSVASKKKRTDTGKNPATSSSVPSAPRGLGSVPTFSIQPRPSTVTFEQLGGCDRQFLEVCRLAMHMKRPHTYNMLGVEPPKGFLVHGPPGCGKTLFAQQIPLRPVARATSHLLPMIQLAAPELVSRVCLGDTEERGSSCEFVASLLKQEVHRVFAEALIQILDDIDAIAPRRETATREMERRVVSQLSNSLDELSGQNRKASIGERISIANDGEVSLMDDEPKSCGHVLVTGTTSRPDAVDGGLRRAGRFDCEISLGIPDEQARQKILHTVCKLPLDDDVSMKMVARLTPGYVGADLSALVREAAKCAINRIFDTIVNHNSSKRHMTNEEIKEELDKVLAWLQADDDPKVLERLGGFSVKMSDFERALENVQPSAKREGFATVPDVSWEDIGALSDIRQELEWNILVSIIWLPIL
ncbi:ATPase, AAA family [Cooperia oncophora]